MCNFHESVAAIAATDPMTGNVHAGQKAVIRVALSRFWASRYIEGAENVDGYNFYPLATADQQAAFERSGLKRPMDEVQKEEAQGIEFLRLKIAELSRHLDLSPQGLELPTPTAREPFLDYAIKNIYEGDPKGDFYIRHAVKRNNLKPLHRAVYALHADERISKTLENLVQGKICMLYTEAPTRVNKTLVTTYENLPERAKAVSSFLAKYGGNIILGGFSGVVGHGIHYGSVLGAGIAAGAASSANLALSGVFFLASYGGWYGAFGGQYKAAKEKVSALAVQAALTFAVAVGAQQVIPHNHMQGERAQWYQSLPPQMRDSLLASSKQSYEALPSDLRRRLDREAAKEGIPPELFLATCSGNNEVSRDIAAYNASKNTSKPAP